MLSRVARSVGGAVRCYCVAAPSAGMDRDPRCYLQSNEQLMYLKSPRTLMFKAETAVDLAAELMDSLHMYKDNPKKCLAIIDAMSAVMCMTLDPAEFVRTLHPREEYRSHAERAYAEVNTHLGHLNTSRVVYEPIIKLCEPENWEQLSPEDKQLVRTLKDDMESIGMNLSPQRAALTQALMTKLETLVENTFSLEDRNKDMTFVISEILSTRHELATTMGYDSYVSWMLRNTLAESPLAVWTLLLKLADKISASAMEELQTLIELRDSISSVKPRDPFTVTDSELRDLIPIYKNRTYGDVDSEMTEFLSVFNVWRGIEIMCQEVFDLTLKEVEMEMNEKYDKNLMKYEVLDAKGNLLGVIYADLLSRLGKPEGTGHFTIQLGCDFSEAASSDLDIIAPENNRILPSVVFTCNCTGDYREDFEPSPITGELPPKKLDRLLITPNDAVSMFHEFGHALHTLLGQTKYQILSGTRSSMDYVEVFSQLFEVYARDYRSLRKWAIHYEDNIPVTRDVVDRMNSAECSFSNLQQLDEILTALVDLVYHGPRPFVYFTLDKTTGSLKVHEVPEGCEDPKSLRALLADTVTPITVTELGNARSLYLTQLIHYPGTYYSYTYSRIIATAIWNKYLEKEPFSLNAGAAIKAVMAKGASATPKALINQLVSTSAEDLLESI